MIKYGFTVLNILLATVLSFVCVDLFYQIVSARLARASLSDLKGISIAESRLTGERIAESAQRRLTYAAYQSIINRDLFKTKGLEKSGEKIDQAQLENLEETDLKLKLWGTVTGSPDKPYAVIEETQNHKQGLYREGDTVQTAQIKAILRKKVVLRVNGRDEILLMEEKKSKAGLSLATRQPYEPSTPFDVEGDTISVDRTQINSALKNINQLMSQVKVRPYFKNGKPNGLVLSNIRRNSIFTQMGLKSGDIVKGVNGSEIKSVDDALKFYENLKSSPSVQLQIERRGEQKNIVYQID